jgi:uncharacterized pyridoxamine 5'-phosphate oxidase family protein
MEIEKWFKDQQVIYFATIDEDIPRVRPVSLIYLDKRFFIITGARGGVNANKLKQIRKNPNTEYYLTLENEEGQGFIRGTGKTIILNDIKLKEMVYNSVEWAKEYFPLSSDPNYVLLEFHHESFCYRIPGTSEIINRIK